MIQIWEVFACMVAGILSGIVCESFFVVAYCVDRKIVRIITDIFCAVLSGAVFILTCIYFRLSDFRIYMAVSIFVGFILYEISIHRILAFFGKRLYNKFGSSWKRILSRLSIVSCKKKNSKKLSSLQRSRR